MAETGTATPPALVAGISHHSVVSDPKDSSSEQKKQRPVLSIGELFRVRTSGFFLPVLPILLRPVELPQRQILIPPSFIPWYKRNARSDQREDAATY